MENSLKNLLVLTGAAIAGGLGGSWAAGRIGTALGVSLGPWGAAAGGMIGAMLATSLAKGVVGQPEALPLPESMAMPDPEQDPEAEPAQS
jgi:phage-related minor tail protein